MTTAHKEALTFLQAHKVGVLSTAAKNGELWGAAIYYTVDSQFNFYFLTHVDSTKYRNMQAHPQVALTVVDDASQSTVQVAGKASEVPLGEEQNEVYRKIVLVHPPNQLSWSAPVTSLDESTIVLLKIVPDTLMYSDFKNAEQHSGAQVHHII